MSIIQNIGKAKKWMQENKVMIELGLMRADDGQISIFYNVLARDRTINTVSVQLTKEMWDEFVSGQKDIIANRT